MSKNDHEKEPKVETQRCNSEPNDSVDKTDCPKRPSIWKELESMGEIPPDATEHTRRNFRPNRRRDEINDFPRFTHDHPTKNADFTRGGRRRGGRRNDHDAYDQKQIRDSERTSPDNYHSDDWSANASHTNNVINWPRGGQVSGTKDSKISKDSPAFRSIQSTLNKDNNGFGRGRSYNRGNNLTNNMPVGETSRGRGSEVSRRGIEVGHWNEDRVKNFDDYNDEDEEVELKSKAGRRAESPTFASVKRAFQTLDQSSRSAKNITNLVLNTMEPYSNDSQKWQTMIDDYLVGYACENGGIYVELAAQMFVRFIDEPTFQKASYIVLMRHIGELMTPREVSRQERLRSSNFCEFFGKLLISSWPPGWDSCAKECNMVVYAVMNAVHTWLRALEKSTSKKAPSRVEVTEICAASLVSLSNATGRKLWLKWPDLVDQMYSALKPVIVSNECGLTEETKLDLLDLFVKLNEWPKPVSQAHHRTSTRDVFSQTIEDGSFSFSQWQNSLFHDVSMPPPIGSGFPKPMSFQGNQAGASSNDDMPTRGLNPRNFLNAPFKR